MVRGALYAGSEGIISFLHPSTSKVDSCPENTPKRVVQVLVSREVPPFPFDHSRLTTRPLTGQSTRRWPVIQIHIFENQQFSIPPQICQPKVRLFGKRKATLQK